MSGGGSASIIERSDSAPRARWWASTLGHPTGREAESGRAAIRSWAPGADRPDQASQLEAAPPPAPGFVPFAAARVVTNRVHLDPRPAERTRDEEVLADPDGNISGVPDTGALGRVHIWRAWARQPASGQATGYRSRALPWPLHEAGGAGGRPGSRTRGAGRGGWPEPAAAALPGRPMAATCPGCSPPAGPEAPTSSADAAVMTPAPPGGRPNSEVRLAQLVTDLGERRQFLFVVADAPLRDHGRISEVGIRAQPVADHPQLLDAARQLATVGLEHL